MEFSPQNINHYQWLCPKVSALSTCRDGQLENRNYKGLERKVKSRAKREREVGHRQWFQVLYKKKNDIETHYIAVDCPPTVMPWLQLAVDHSVMLTCR